MFHYAAKKIQQYTGGKIMGTFAGLYGNCKIPEDRKDEFTELVMQLLYHGGMMQFEEIRFQRRQIHVLHPFEFNEKGYAEWFGSEKSEGSLCGRSGTCFHY